MLSDGFGSSSVNRASKGRRGTGVASVARARQILTPDARRRPAVRSGHALIEGRAMPVDDGPGLEGTGRDVRVCRDHPL